MLSQHMYIHCISGCDTSALSCLSGVYFEAEKSIEDSQTPLRLDSSLLHSPLPLSSPTLIHREPVSMPHTGTSKRRPSIPFLTRYARKCHVVSNFHLLHYGGNCLLQYGDD